jgi:hypothetical protein
VGRKIGVANQRDSTMTLTMSQRADALEHKMSVELDKFAARSNLFTSGERDPRLPNLRPAPGQLALMGDDPRLPPMPAAPTLGDFWRLRFAPGHHLLQSARLAQKAGHSEKVVLACLLHDISMIGFIRNDHGYWGAELIAPYVDEEVSWAIRYHQALRFFPDEAAGYGYPEMYVRLFGADYKPEPYIVEAHNYARAHKWYGTARLITLNDIYAWDPDAVVNFEDFTDVIGRHFKQPKEGLGFDNSPCAHLWRTMIWPTKFL